MLDCMCLIYWVSPRGLVANVLDCNIVGNDFEFLSRYYVHFWAHTFREGRNFLITSAMGKIVSLLSFYKDGFGIK